LAIAIAVAACSADPPAGAGADPIPPITAADFETLINSSNHPLVVNVWASWCVPCRSEAPLLRAAHESFGDRIRFIGIDVRDSQGEALAFMAEFGIAYENYFDREGAIPSALGGFGVPLTFFFAPGGERVFFQPGVIDERTLALQIDELLARS
jgi:cytochrome c biogenesis protein CcmG/thiol:disulfide interchange protein DsbE